MSGQAGYLGGGRRARPREAEAPDRLSGSDPRVRLWEDGPWPGAQIPAPPAELFVLWRHVTGRELSREEFELLERLRGHVGYTGPIGTPELRAALQRALAAAPGAEDPQAPPTPEELDGLDDFGDVGGSGLTPDTRRG